MRASFFALTLVAASIGCSSSSAPTRTVTGQLRTTTSAAVTAQSADHQPYASTMSGSGRFTLQLPTGASYELLVGQAQISWPTAKGPARWAKLGEGPTLDLGHVSKQGDGHYACDHEGSDDDHCDRDDDEDGGDTADHDDDGYGGYGGGEHHGCDGGMQSGGGGGTGGGGAGGGGGSTGGGGIP